MPLPSTPAHAVLRHPGRFVLRVLQGFRANQGMLLSGAVAYYTLLSVVPLCTLVLVGLSHVVDEGRLLVVIGRYLKLMLPGDSQPMIEQIATFLKHRDLLSWVLIAMMIFFSSMAFTVLENAISVIFFHRVEIRRRHFLISAILPYLFILMLAMGFLMATLISGMLQAIDGFHFELLGRQIVLNEFSATLIYLIGVIGEILVFTAVYLLMPVGRLSLRHALIGGVTASLLWELTRRVLVWYFTNLSLVNVVYGSLTTAIVALLSLEVAAIILLLGAQVIAEYERFGTELESKEASRGINT
jgi:YihY family inner membrane protein